MQLFSYMDNNINKFLQLLNYCFDISRGFHNIVLFPADNVCFEYELRLLICDKMSPV